MGETHGILVFFPLFSPFGNEKVVYKGNAENNEVTFEDIISEDERYVIVNQPSNEYAIIRRLRSLSSSLIHFFLD